MSEEVNSSAKRKRCPSCKEKKSISKFNKNQNYCWECQRQIQRRRYRTVWIRTGNRKSSRTITGIIKRPYPHKCELCHRRVGIDFKWLNYHHWDGEDLYKGKYIKGVWVCPSCHFICGIIDGNSLLGQKYYKLKRAIDQQFRKRQLSTISER